MQHHGAALRRLTDHEWVHAVSSNWRTADLSARNRAILAYAEKLTLTPADMVAGDLAPMREAGITDEGILHACQVTAYFNYINRMADGLGVTLEPDWDEPIYAVGKETSG